MNWAFNRMNLVFGIVALMGIAQFFYAVPLATNVYPGGYSVTEHFLSDLGCTVTASRKENSASATIFNRSVIVLGTLLIPFFGVMPRVWSPRGWIMRCSGVLSSAGLIGIGLTPCDQHFVGHHVALGIWILPMLVLVVTFAASADLNRTGSATLYLCTLLVVSAACAYAFAGDRHGYVVFQKIFAVIAVFWFCLVFVMVSVATVRSIPSRRLIVEQQAREYLEVIQRNPRRRKSANHRRTVMPE